MFIGITTSLRSPGVRSLLEKELKVCQMNSFSAGDVTFAVSLKIHPNLT